MDRDPLNECDGRDETNDQDDLSAERGYQDLPPPPLSVLSIIFLRCELDIDLNPDVSADTAD